MTCRAFCHSEGGRMPDRGSLAGGSTACRAKERFSRRVHGTHNQCRPPKRRLTPLYNSDPPLNPLLGGDFCRAIYRAPCGAWQASLRVPWWGVDRLSVTPREGIARLWESRGREYRMPYKTEILTSRARHAPQNDRAGISSPTRFFVTFHYTQNDKCRADWRAAGRSARAKKFVFKRNSRNFAAG